MKRASSPGIEAAMRQCVFPAKSSSDTVFELVCKHCAVYNNYLRLSSWLPGRNASYIITGTDAGPSPQIFVIRRRVVYPTHIPLNHLPHITQRFGLTSVSRFRRPSADCRLLYSKGIAPYSTGKLMAIELLYGHTC